MKPNDPSIELQPVIETVCQLYCAKIAADLQADSSHIRRQTLPEFMYSTYLFQTGEPSAAKHALTEFITLVYYFEKVFLKFFHQFFLLEKWTDQFEPRLTPDFVLLANFYQTLPVFCNFLVVLQFFILIFNIRLYF